MSDAPAETAAPAGTSRLPDRPGRPFWAVLTVLALFAALGLGNLAFQRLHRAALADSPARARARWASPLPH